ncbi:MAG TPA: RDD family protein [Solirubrobacteraceae bacterium]|nr:RDD family protein [Solirubrobacteraceae bacterium]
MSFAARFHRRAAAPAAVVPAVAVAPDVVVVAPAAYVGLVTRAIAFGLDAALINVVAILTAAVVGLTFSIVSIPHELKTIAIAAGGVLYVLWIVGYFVTFWSTTGQTPGNRMLRIRVRAVGGERLLPRRSLLRFVGLTLAALPLFLGFLIILIDDRRRGLQDRLARTVVVEDPREELVTRRPLRRKDL